MVFPVQVFVADGLFIQTLFENPRLFFLQLLIVTFSICVHEYCHAWTALKMGDSTAADQGHLTLNPMKQMGWMSIAMLLFIGIAWGAVPVDRARLKSRYRYGAVLTSLAGPFANLGLFLIAWILFGILMQNPPEKILYVLQAVFLFGLMNGILFLLNILPIPGLDGGNCLLELFPDLCSRIYKSESARGVYVILIFAVFFFSSYLSEFSCMVMAYAPEFFSSLLN